MEGLTLVLTDHQVDFEAAGGEGENEKERKEWGKAIFGDENDP